MARVRIEKGSTYTASVVRTGSGERGNWEMIVVKDDNGKNDLTLFTSKGNSGVVEGAQFRVTDITSVSKGFRKKENGNWEANVSAEVDIEIITNGNAFVEDFSTDNPWDDLPL